MASSKQRQQLAKQRKTQEKFERKHNQILNQTPEGYNWAKVGMFNVRIEAEQVANCERLRKGLPVVKFGTHWNTWRHDGHDYLQIQRETLECDSQKQITGFKYISDNITWTTHCLERLWERNGFGLGSEVEYNLGIANLDKYLGYINDGKPSRVLGEIAIRSDVVVPFLGGLLLGIIKTGEIEFGMRRKGKKCHLWVEDNGALTCPYTGTKTTHHRFTALTWIALDKARDEQQAVAELLSAGDWLSAAQRMMDIKAYQYEAINPKQHEIVRQEAELMLEKAKRIAVGK